MSVALSVPNTFVNLGNLDRGQQHLRRRARFVDHRLIEFVTRRRVVGRLGGIGLLLGKDDLLAGDVNLPLGNSLVVVRFGHFGHVGRHGQIRYGDEHHIHGNGRVLLVAAYVGGDGVEAEEHGLWRCWCTLRPRKSDSRRQSVAARRYRASPVSSAAPS